VRTDSKSLFFIFKSIMVLDISDGKNAFAVWAAL
jgi:hypothetical protein